MLGDAETVSTLATDNHSVTFSDDVQNIEDNTIGAFHTDQTEGATSTTKTTISEASALTSKSKTSVGTRVTQIETANHKTSEDVAKLRLEFENFMHQMLTKKTVASDMGQAVGDLRVTRSSRHHCTGAMMTRGNNNVDHQHDALHIYITNENVNGTIIY